MAQSQEPPSSSLSEDKLLISFFRWLVPRWWDKLWGMFKADGSMEWDKFEEILRYDHKLGPSARRIFESLGDGNGVLTKKTLLDVKKQYQRFTDFRQYGATGFRQRLSDRFYGNYIKAWRLLLDPDDRGFCCHADFVKACKTMDYSGELQTCWRELTGGVGGASRPMMLGDIDMESEKLLTRLIHELRRKHTNPRDGWYAALRTHGTATKMTFAQFQYFCQELDFTVKEARLIFNGLDKDNDRRLSMDEWKFLGHYESRTNYFEDSGSVAPVSASRLSPRYAAGASVADSTWHATGLDVSGSTFEFLVVLTKDEHEEYQRRRRERAKGQQAGISPAGGGYPASLAKAYSWSDQAMRPRGPGSPARGDDLSTGTGSRIGGLSGYAGMQ
jgi:hypothetical protein